MPVIARRFLQWTVLCSICAVPSFMVAYDGFDTGGMIAGVILFIVAYTLVTSTERFSRFERRPFIRRTMVIGYGTRVVCSLFYPAGVILDFIPGLISVMFVEAIWTGGAGGGRSGITAVQPSFFATFAITLIQGTLLNTILIVFMAIVYSIQRAFCTWPEPQTGLCERCGYDLRASYQFGRCPECGTPCSAPAENPHGHIETG